MTKTTTTSNARLMELGTGDTIQDLGPMDFVGVAFKLGEDEVIIRKSLDGGLIVESGRHQASMMMVPYAKTGVEIFFRHQFARKPADETYPVTTKTGRTVRVTVPPSNNE